MGYREFSSCKISMSADSVFVKLLKAGMCHVVVKKSIQSMRVDTLTINASPTFVCLHG